MCHLVKATGALCLVVALLVAIVPSNGTPSARAGSVLVVYTRLNTQEVKLALEPALIQWSKQTGVRVEVRYDPYEDNFPADIKMTHTGIPDIMLGLPDDSLGQFYEQQVVAPGAETRVNLKGIVPSALAAVTIGGRVMAVPLALDTMALVYNQRLVPNPPATFDQLISIALGSRFSRVPSQTGQVASGCQAQQPGATYGFQYDIANLYFSYGLISALGGYVFLPSAAGFDPKQVGLYNGGSLQAMRFLQNLVLKYRLMPAGITYYIARCLFQQGHLGMFIDDDSDIVANQKALGSAFRAVPLPSLQGHTSRPFAVVQVAFVNQYSRNQPLAWRLLAYLTQQPLFWKPDLSIAGRLPVSMADLKVLTQAPIYGAYAASAQYADALPNVLEMGKIWGPTDAALNAVIRGQDPAAAATVLKTQISF